VIRRHAIVIGLFLVSAASLLFEILLTKFFGSKLEHHFTFAIISTAMLGFGMAGTWVHIRPALFPTEGGPRADVLASYAWKFGLSCLVVIPIFCALPIDPLIPDWRGTIAMPLFFLMFVLPFFYVGVCVSYTLIAARQGPGVIYFWDLLGAGIGAAIAAWSISKLTGYGAVVLVGLIALAGAAVYWRASDPKPRGLNWRLALYALASLGVLIYPAIGRKLYGHDVFAIKYLELRQTLLMDFGGIEMSFWNAVARIDVSKTADSHKRTYRSGIAHRFEYMPIPGRFILVDGGASTRQFALSGPADEQEWLKNSLWAAPYAGRDPNVPFERSLVIGAGGGVDVLVAKSYKTARVDALELNPDTFKILRGRPEDPKAELYTRYLHGGLLLRNTEARHYCHTLGGQETYDVIEASGVDTLTAIQSAANALSENFLYTQDAVADYYRLLKPGGILSLSHGYSSPASLTLRKFVTYLDFLAKLGVKDPGKSVVLIFDHYFENSMLKKGEFTREEIDRLELWAKVNNYLFIYHPFMAPDTPPTPPIGYGDDYERMDKRFYDHLAKIQYAPFLDPERTPITDADLPFVKLGLAKSSAEREAILDGLKWDVHPSTDDRPYFYFVRPNHSNWMSAIDGAFIYPQPAVRWMFLAALLASIGLVVAPMFIKRDKAQSGQARASVLRALPFFALCGFGFMLVENSAFLNLTLFVGGPLYSLQIVLPTILIGYAVGSLLTDRYLTRIRKSFVWVLGLYVGGFLAYWALVKLGLPHLIGKSWLLRVIVSVIVTVPLGALLGVVVPWYMHNLKGTDKRSLAWMWAVSSAFNVLGSMLFVPVCFAIGRSWTLLLSAALYIAAILWAGVVLKPLRTEVGEA
jgi:SAM-dependent methyltransferase